MTRLALIAALLTLAGCGIDGPPEQPEGGISVSGEARIGVVGSL
jgi:predicted small lipoprotein YifL